MAPMNLYLKDRPVDLIQTGIWTKKAAAELDKLAQWRLAGSSEAHAFRRLPASEELDLNPDASYVHLASNNTIAGTQWRTFPETGAVPVVADMSSDIMSRPVEVSRFGIIFAGAQKNMGPAGVTLIIIRKDLAERAPKELPTWLQYRTHIKAGSLYHTPPVFAIYMLSLVLDWLEAEGGPAAAAQRGEARAGLLYEAIDRSRLFYCPVQAADRSRMNVVFRVNGDRQDLEEKFVKQSAAAGLVGLKGHRSVGGLRASLYNAQTGEAVQALVEFMKEFEARNG